MRHARWLLLLLLIPGLVQAATQVRAFLDRDTVHLGESVTLNLAITGAGRKVQPDLSALVPDFVVKGTSRNFSATIANGEVRTNVLFAVALEPRRAGTLVIPALSVDGAQSAPLTLVVLPATDQPTAGPDDPVFVRAHIEPDTVYVGQQAHLRVRLYYRGGQIQGNLEDPEVDGASISKLGQQRQYQTVVSGKRWQVVERDYALVADQPGILHIAPVQFQGSTGSGPAGFGALFGNRRSVSVHSGALALEVRERAASADSGTWLPARTLSLHLDGLPADGEASVGAPLTLTITVAATGLDASVLPEITLPKIAGADVYPDQPQRHADSHGPWVKGTVTRKFAIIPTRAGTLHLPAIALDWWNVVEDHAATAHLEPHDIVVMAATGTGTVLPATPASTSPPAVVAGAARSAVPSAPSPAGAASDAANWRLLAVAALLLWLVTALAWAGSRWRQRKPGDTPSPSPAAPDASRARSAFRAAADVDAQARTLLQWAHAEKPQLHDLGAVAVALDEPRQQRMLERLQRARFGTGTDAPAVADVRRVFSRGFAWRQLEKPAPPVLPPLYPAEATESAARPGQE